ncbi:protein phosphatase 1 regulatory subunit 21 [Sitodiplosis mosellana]|uniref:protein phosphatase 1 regulatory subunit 21 n=1 Tax=Sitodiplosis mosellana TaxID=263140 RepID=UPI002443B224|nr:protein phosphatase 1 regulatory subunit 21 [Sitodiplosis mosellana]
MDASNLEEKYKKLAAEYSKLRAQAGVLKRAVVEEQNKNATLREVFRVNETNLRRAEQEVDSLSFRNKQLELRCASLQDDLIKDASKKGGKNAKSKDKTSNVNATQMSTDDGSVLSEEFQKKIFECAQLTSSIADKNTEIQLQANRIEELENLLRSMNAEQTETETKLRREVERLTVKTHDLEAKLAEATSIVGSDDTLYVSELEQQKSINSCSTGGGGNNKLDERILALEKDLIHWRTQCEILQMKGKLDKSNANAIEQNKIDTDNMKNAENEKTTLGVTVGERLLIENYSKKIEDLLTAKCLAESKLAMYIEECDSLQKHLAIVNNDLNEEERKFRVSQRDLQLADEDLATTRINYEEQISVLTEQVISLSDQLAALK